MTNALFLFLYNSFVQEICFHCTYKNGGFGSGHFSDNLKPMGCYAICNVYHTAHSRSPPFLTVAWQETDSREFSYQICNNNVRVPRNKLAIGGSSGFLCQTNGRDSTFRKGLKFYFKIIAMATGLAIITAQETDSLTAVQEAFYKTTML